VRTAPDGRTLLQRLVALAGVPDTGPEMTDAHLFRLADERRQRGVPPLVVLDGVAVPHPTTTGLTGLIQGAAATRAATILVGGPPGLAAALTRAGVDFRDRAPTEVAVPPLDADQVAHYIRAWIAAARPAGARPVILTPDALLLLHHRSGGCLARLNQLALNALVLAAAARAGARGPVTVTSFEAWGASDRVSWADAEAGPALPRRPYGWPPHEVGQVIDTCRHAAGLPPRPATGPGGTG
jgi:hypothetical protein